MFAFIIRRLLIGLLIIWGVYTLTFLAVNLAPGDPFTSLENPKMTKEDLDRLRVKWGYDKPVLTRYFLHVSKLFWRRDEVRRYEAGGVALELFARDGRNHARGTLQTPPDELLLVATSKSRRDFGAVDVLLRRGPDGTYSSSRIRPGRYGVGEAEFVAGESDSDFETAGVTLSIRGGVVSARPTLSETPARIVFENVETGEQTPVERDGDATDAVYGPGPLPGGRQRFGKLVILVPEKPLETAGPTIDLGTSILAKQPVASYLAAPLRNSLLLGVAALFFDYLLGIIIGVVSAVRQHSRLDNVLTLGALFVYSMPGFWLGLMLMLVFAIGLHWLPAEGMHSVGENGVLDLLEHMLMPTFVLGIAAAASTARYQRSALLEVLAQDYIRTARAKGLAESTVIWKHAMRNALIPVITLFGLTLPFLVSGAVIVEQVFSWPGMGREVITAINGRDVFVVSGITLIGTTMVVLGSLVADILYALVDPRVRLE